MPIKRKVITPKGEFSSLTAAAKQFGVTPSTILLWTKTNPSEFYYKDGEPPVKYRYDDVDLSIATKLSIKGQEYEVSDLFSKVTKPTTLTLKNGRFTIRNSNVTSYEGHLKVAMSSLDELETMYPGKTRHLLSQQRINSRKKVENDPIYIAWSQSQSKNKY